MVKQFYQSVSVLSLLFFFAVGLQAQKASPPAKAEGMVGDAKVTIDYHQPGVKGREIWGGLVPYDNVWRTGANNATVFETTGDITIGGKTLKAGKYGLWTIPGKKEWTWIFSSTWDTWGTNYDPTADVLRVTGKFSKRSEPMERMTFTIADGKVSLHWSDMVASVTVE